MPPTVRPARPIVGLSRLEPESEHALKLDLCVLGLFWVSVWWYQVIPQCALCGDTSTPRGRLAGGGSWPGGPTEEIACAQPFAATDRAERRSNCGTRRGGGEPNFKPYGSFLADTSVAYGLNSSFRTRSRRPKQYIASISASARFFPADGALAHALRRARPATHFVHRISSERDSSVATPAVARLGLPLEPSLRGTRQIHAQRAHERQNGSLGAPVHVVILPA
jgi:hypothetical protein